LADPKLAPYGLAALETMTRLGVLASLRPQWVLGENIAQTYQFVSTGNAQLGFVALSQVLTDGRIAQGSAWVIPEQLHTPIRQDALLLRQGQAKPAALALLHYLQSEKARHIIRASGYKV
jgi:molybdate transport system substrate-binding protein